jgi:hypothetical protein
LLYFFASDRIQGANSVVANQPSKLKDSSNGADLVIITHQTLAGSLTPLVEQRRSQGLSVAVVDIEDVYDEFSFGNKSPQAIKDFLSYASSTWSKAPRFLLLAGDTSFDPRNYLGLGNQDFVATKMIDTFTMEAASDDWFADFNNDGIPELAVGRLPVKTATEAAKMVAKIVGYDSGEPASGVLLVADANLGFDFEGTDSDLRALLPAGTDVQEVFRGRINDNTLTRSQLLAGINSGKKMVNYAGHGSHNIWNFSILTNRDSPNMTNSKLSLFVSMTCMNGYFLYPTALNESLAESWIKSPGGAIAAWASAGMTPPDGQAEMDLAVTNQLFGSTGTTIGEATVRAKAAVLDYDVRRTWILFGDPTTRLR